MITIEAKGLEKAQEILQHIPGGARQAIARAINRSAESASTAAVRQVRAQYFIEARTVKETIKIKKASSGSLAASVFSSGNLIPLAKFKASAPTVGRPKKPILVSVKRGGARGEGKGAFWATMRSGHTGIFGRIGSKRKPILERFGPSVPQMLGEETVSKFVENRAQEVMDQRLDHEISRLLAREAGK